MTPSARSSAARISSSKELQDLLGLSDEELIRTLDASALELLAGSTRDRPELGILLDLLRDAEERAGATLLREGDAQAWLPFDTPGGVRRFLRHYAPVAGVLMETEIWPNLTAIASESGVGLGKVAQPLRVALTGTAVSPPIDATAALIGRERVLGRLDSALQWAAAGPNP